MDLFIFEPKHTRGEVKDNIEVIGKLRKDSSTQDGAKIPLTAEKDRRRNEHWQVT